MKGKMENTAQCENCNSALEPNYKYCPYCGQESHWSGKLGGLFSNFLSDYFTFDSKIIRSLKPLLIRPGFLTLAYLEGKRVHYISPLRMFIFLSIIFFLLLTTGNPSNVTYSGEIGFGDDFWNSFFESRMPKLFFFLLPVFALLVALLYRKQKKGLLNHFLFALHFHSSIFLMGIIYSLLSKLFALMEWQAANFVLLIIFSIYLAFYLWRALRNVYAEGRGKTLWKYLVLAVLYSIILVSSSVLLLALSING